MDKKGIQFGPLGSDCAHLCVDAQRMFAESTDWHTPWFNKILPAILRLARPYAAQTLFTRFIPPAVAADAPGVWQNIFVKWPSMTRNSLDPAMLDLVQDLAQLSSPERVFDKHFYSPWFDTDLHPYLQDYDIKSLVISGGETEMCVLSTVQGAIDLGYRVIIAKDALWSSKNETHDAIIDLYHERYSLQVEAAMVDEILANWRY